MHINRVLVRAGLFAGCLALAYPGFAFTQEATDEEASALASPVVATVYIQTLKGVNAYTANAAGKLTSIKGSPFATAGQMEGINGKYLLSVGNTNIRVYPIKSNGAIGKQVSMVNTQNYSGAQCGVTSDGGSPDGAILDHTGKYFYIQLYSGYSSFCADWQTYRIQSDGQLTFLGDQETDFDDGFGYVRTTVPTISSNDKFGYSEYWGNYGAAMFVGMSIEKSGVLELNSSFTAETPLPEDPQGVYFPEEMSAAPAGHLAVLLDVQEPYDDLGIMQLASYGINASGGISSSNTWQNMPTLSSVWSEFPGMTMSTSGKLLAVYGGAGVQLFHFNGASPITPYSAVLLSGGVDKVQWDNSNHMYALNFSAGKLHVFTATPGTISEVAGSPYTVPSPYGIVGMIVVPK